MAGGGSTVAGTGGTGLGAPDATGLFPDWYKEMMQRTASQQEADRAQSKERSDALYSTLATRAGQGLAVDRTDPSVRAQSDAYAANATRANRDFVSNLAESAGPGANLEGQKRIAAEHLGQATGAFEAEAIAREIGTRRAEIAQALSTQAGILTADQARALQLQLASMDQAIAELNAKSQARGVDIQGRAVDIQGRSVDNAFTLGQGNLDVALQRLGLDKSAQNFYQDRVWPAA